MSDNLSDFLARRRSALRAERDLIRRRLFEIEKELTALDAAEDAAKNILESSNKSDVYIGSTQINKEKTIIESVLDILKKHENGLIAIDILRELNMGRSHPLERSSLSPQLSRMKARGMVNLVGSNWVLADEHKNKGV